MLKNHWLSNQVIFWWYVNTSTCRTCVYFEFPLILYMWCILYFETIDVLENIDFIIYKNVYLFKWDICIRTYIYINNETFLIYIINLSLTGWILHTGSKKKKTPSFITVYNLDIQFNLLNNVWELPLFSI